MDKPVQIKQSALFCSHGRIAASDGWRAGVASLAPTHVQRWLRLRQPGGAERSYGVPIAAEKRHRWCRKPAVLILYRPQLLWKRYATRCTASESQTEHMACFACFVSRENDVPRRLWQQDEVASVRAHIEQII
jgi:hypothetical protein